MSHEIRTPINGLVGYLSIIKEECTGKLSTNLDDAFTFMGTATKRIIRTVDEILNMSELQTGNYSPNIQNLDIVPLINKIFSDYGTVAENRKIKFNFEKKCEKAVVLGDDYSITQIISHLVDNALKFTEQGSVNISINSNEEGKVVLNIVDTGIGISDKFLPQIFEPFLQEDQGYSRKYEGNGLG